MTSQLRQRYQYIYSDMKVNFIFIFISTLLFKIYLSSAIPITSDEALFFVWSKDISLGYYDHPPMIAWVIWLFSKISHDLVAIRFPATTSNHIIALGIVYLIQKIQSKKNNSAYLIGSIYLLLPLSLLSVFITNDVPLSLFCFMSFFCFVYAENLCINGTNKNKILIYILYAAAGIFVGLAFLSKYLAALLAISYFLTFIYHRRWRYFFIILLFGAPFIVLNIYWNLQNCWQNILFNMVNRTEDFVAPWEGLPKYLLSLLYAFTPLLIKYLWDVRRTLPQFKSLLILAFTPFTLYALLSMKQIIGLHWLPAIMPPVLLIAGLSLQDWQLTRVKKWAIYLSFGQFLLLGLFFIPSSIWQSYDFYKGLSLLKNSSHIATLVNQEMGPNTTLMTLGYSSASNFEYQLNKRIPVFGMGSKFARHDDLHYDFKKLNGQNIRVFVKHGADLAEFAPFFEKAVLKKIAYDGLDYYYVDGSIFKYAVYREEILKKIANRYYQIPSFLPACKCDFLSKYAL